MSRLLLLAMLLVITGCGTIAAPVTNSNAAIVLQPPVEPVEISEPLVTGDLEAGRELFTTFQPAAGIACSTCHLSDSENRLIGPGLLHVAQRANSRVPDMAAADYVRLSIIDPAAYVVEGYPDVMPKNWGKVFSETQLNDLVAYLMSL